MNPGAASEQKLRSFMLTRGADKGNHLSRLNSEGNVLETRQAISIAFLVPERHVLETNFSRHSIRNDFLRNIQLLSVRMILHRNFFTEQTNTLFEIRHSLHDLTVRSPKILLKKQEMCQIHLWYSNVVSGAELRTRTVSKVSARSISCASGLTNRGRKSCMT